MDLETTVGLSEKLLGFAEQLSPNERDALKFQLSVASANELENDFEISHSPEKRSRFSEFLRCTLAIQPFRERVPKYGIVYRGRPDFMTDDLVQQLRAEALSFRPQAKENYEQFIVTVDTPDDSTVCEKLAASDDLYRLVTQHAGPCQHSYISSYIYYEVAGQCSKPHVDNAFTSVTVMIGLRNDQLDPAAPSSTSIVYWPDSPPMEYRLEPGELAIFFGVCVLHGRSPISAGETVHSLLLSFQPRMDNEIGSNASS
ncbi:hypothetical protein [Paraherbaspirillum soli]|uniref:Fe2OG dioxygenase domain-containing protein n=1 Tax=Paraherbaspirillum soli TaxID=631222 RepID=A0ABW0M510_9BURK